MGASFCSHLADLLLPAQVAERQFALLEKYALFRNAHTLLANVGLDRFPHSFVQLLIKTCRDFAVRSVGQARVVGPTILAAATAGEGKGGDMGDMDDDDDELVAPPPPAAPRFGRQQSGRNVARADAMRQVLH